MPASRAPGPSPRVLCQATKQNKQKKGCKISDIMQIRLINTDCRSQLFLMQQYVRVGGAAKHSVHIAAHTRSIYDMASHEIGRCFHGRDNEKVTSNCIKKNPTTSKSKPERF